MAADRDALLADVHAQAVRTLGGRPTREAVLAAVAACHAAAGTAIGARLAEAETLGERSACRAGCAFCCHQHIAATPAELLGIATEVATWPAERIEALRRRLEQDVPRIAALDHAGRQAARIACPMLDRKTGQCGAYAQRPVACRSHFSTLRTACERDFRTRGARRPNDKGVPTMESPKATAGAALVGLELALDELGLAVEPVELAVGLRLALDQPDVFDRWLAGENPFPPLPAPPNSARARLGRRYSDMLGDVRARLAPTRKTSDKSTN
ncbi:YkgJ family cysteine cluster protein [Azospirillum sp.]|uniref:YkgJ family cysteine cluster protein n=1 Tax=Azospirillum sp. TaxID=34012 RepID=UPI002D5A1E0D|nr:YkgJ family cysteine cluster protein [Azospirillum sp.]HYD67699.1 YkgJ family cysteine cluster protein [Azospirillum sp.]